MTEDRRSDAFTADKFRWLDQVFADRALSPLAFKAAYVIARFMNRDTLDAWPGQSRLAAECGVTRNGICGAIDALCNRGHLSVTPGKWRGVTSRYVWRFQVVGDETDNVTPFPTKGQRGFPLSAVSKAPTPVAPSQQKAPTDRAESANGSVHEAPTGVGINPYIETLYKPRRGSGADAPAEIQKSTEEKAAPLDARSLLFRDGLATLRRITGRPDGPCRAILGRWLKAANDDARRVLRSIEDAGDLNPADPVAWVEGALRQRNGVASKPGADLPPSISDGDWQTAIARFHDGRGWPPALGPSPGQPGCKAPARLWQNGGAA